jgi:hypothetical protein
LVIWFSVAALVFVLLWPAMWVDPLGSLGRVFSTALAYAEEGHARGNFFNGMIFAEGDLPWYFYLIAYAWRTTPIVVLGLILAFLALIFRRRLNLPSELLSLVPVLTLFAALFTIFMSLGAKKFDRYLLPIFMPLDLVAGVGWLAFLNALHRWLIQYRPAVWMRLSSIVLPGALVLIQLLGVLHTFPYYLNYYNPWLGGDRVADNVMMVGWGEGLDQAARYLNSIPVAKGVRVLSWYGEGCLSYFYEGVSDTFGDDYAYTNLRSDDFVVLYLNQWQRRLPSKNFLSIFERFPAEYIVRLGNLEYARVYDMSKAPAGVLP